MNSDYQSYLQAPDGKGAGNVFGVMVSDKKSGIPRQGTKGAEMGVYFFGGNHIDRSPTGSAAAARVALDISRGNIGVGDSWTYHSIPSHAFGLEGLVATALSHVEGGPVEVQIEGFAYYTGYTTLLHEEGDKIGKRGFLLEEILA